jgi:predicted RNA-binding Zn ribbon-like protein
MLKDYSGRAALTAVDLVNSYDVVSSADVLGDGVALAELLTRRGWEITEPIGQAVVDRLSKLRPRLRAVFGTSDTRKSVETLNLILQETATHPWLTDHDGSWHWHYVSPGANLADRIATACAVALLTIIADDGLDRLRVCQGYGCHRVFIDASKPGARRFCDARRCGNRAHISAYRARQKAGRERAH